MKCIIDFWKIENALKDTATEYLKNAVSAHGGAFSWVNVGDDVDVPVVAAFSDDGPTDMIIQNLSIENNALVIVAKNKATGLIENIKAADIVSASQMQFIIEAIPEPQN